MLDSHPIDRYRAAIITIITSFKANSTFLLQTAETIDLDITSRIKKRKP
jgi:hypothetical protein